MGSRTLAPHRRLPDHSARRLAGRSRAVQRQSDRARGARDARRRQRPRAPAGRTPRPRQLHGGRPADERGPRRTQRVDGEGGGAAQQGAEGGARPAGAARARAHRLRLRLRLRGIAPRGERPRPIVRVGGAHREAEVNARQSVSAARPLARRRTGSASQRCAPPTAGRMLSRSPPAGRRTCCSASSSATRARCTTRRCS